MYIISYYKWQVQRANRDDQDEAAHNELPHLDLHCLEIRLFHFLMLQGLTIMKIKYSVMLTAK